MATGSRFSGAGHKDARVFVVLLHFYSSRPTPAYGELARHFRDRSHTVWIGQPSIDSDFVFLDDHGVVDRIPGPSRQIGGRLRLLPFMMRLRDHVQAIHPDIVQVTPCPWSWVLACGNTGNIVFVNDIRTAGSGVGLGCKAWLIDWSAWVSWRIGSALLYDRTFFLNETGARWLLGDKWPGRADVVPLGVSADFLDAVVRPRVASTPDVVRFLYLGTISLARNLEQILAAARALRLRTTAFRVTLVGPDDDAGSRDAICGLVEQYNLQDVVEVMDPVPYERVPELLLGFDVALNYVPATLVQRRQTFLKVLECRAVGLPQITTRTDPNAAVVREGENGLLVEDSADQYAAAMQQLIDDPSLLSRLKRRAEEMRTAVTWKDVADRHLSIYASLREVRKRRAPSSAGAAQA